MPRQLAHALVLVVAVAACDETPTPQELLVGSWQCESRWEQEQWNSRIEYRADGTYLELETFEYPKSDDERIDIRDEGVWFFAGKTLIEEPRKFQITGYAKGNQSLPPEQAPADFREFVEFAERSPFGVKIRELTERVFNSEG